MTKHVIFNAQSLKLSEQVPFTTATIDETSRKRAQSGHLLSGSYKGKKKLRREGESSSSEQEMDEDDDFFKLKAQEKGRWGDSRHL